MAVMYTANHMRVRAIVALTESGMTPLWMSRIRSDIPIYAFTRHEATRRRVTLYRGVYAVPFDIVHTETEALYSSIFDRLLELGLVDVNDLVILTKGELSGRVRRHQLDADPARGQPLEALASETAGTGGVRRSAMLDAWPPSHPEAAYRSDRRSGWYCRAAARAPPIRSACSRRIARDVRRGAPNPFPIIVGTSAGAVSAAVLATEAYRWQHAVDCARARVGEFPRAAGVSGRRLEHAALRACTGCCR